MLPAFVSINGQWQHLINLATAKVVNQEAQTLRPGNHHPKLVSQYCSEAEEAFNQTPLFPVCVDTKRTIERECGLRPVQRCNECLKEYM